MLSPLNLFLDVVPTHRAVEVTLTDSSQVVSLPHLGCTAMLFRWSS